jgi:hypothetical protein
VQGPSQYGSTLTIPYGATNNQARIVIDGNRGAIFIYGAGSTTVTNATIVQSQVVPNALSGSFTNPTGSGNTVVVVVDAFSTTSGLVPSVSGMTLGGVADHFANVITATSPFSSAYMFSAIWYDPNAKAGQTAVVVSGSNLSVNANYGIILYEVSGLLIPTSVDKTSAGTTTTGTPWSSGTTPTTTDANEVWFGAISPFASTAQPSGWTNQEFSVNGQGAGYQIVSTTGTATYAASQTSSGPSAAVVATFKSTGTTRPNLRDAIAAISGTDPFGTPYPADFTSFFPNTPGVYVNLSGASVLFMQIGSNQPASIGSSTAGVLLLESGLVTGGDTIAELFLSSSVANSNTTPLVDILVTGGNLAVNGTNMTVP